MYFKNFISINTLAVVFLLSIPYAQAETQFIDEFNSLIIQFGHIQQAMLLSMAEPK